MVELPDNLAILRQLCDEKKLAIRGTKKVLKERLIKNGVTTYQPKEATFFDDLKRPELVLECKSRGLTHSKCHFIFVCVHTAPKRSKRRLIIC